MNKVWLETHGKIPLLLLYSVSVISTRRILVTDVIWLGKKESAEMVGRLDWLM